MERCEQGAAVYLRRNGQLLVLAQSRASNGLLGGHGKFAKLQIDEADEALGVALRARLEDRKPGFHHPHMHREKEAFQAVMAEYRKDRGVESDKAFFKGTRIVSVSVYADRIEFRSADNTGPTAPWIEDPPPLQVAPDASDLELGSALRRALDVAKA
ncbi:hypothetical protein GLA29479_2985 [Lysobacter antibioticus]|uniref:hypothetical protein n=1 Tax=Lysobacter antibioticus TaxID=84531 RepID=UPI000716E69F|nr:hypothetical protein [Lysobacter antibioticus]ALN63848.1 hypothetical protein GLA29479_2985 [Lysobacter antibioticus]